MHERESFKGLLLKTYERYPKMQIQDMVKLIYQNEFAGGHMVDDEEMSFERLKREYGSFGPASPGADAYCAFEDIGNGLCRLNLLALNNIGISLETVNMLFINTANSVHGSIRSFEEKLAILKRCCEDKSLPYTVREVETYLNGLMSKGYPPVGHSEVYTKQYSPSYRIVKSAYRDYLEVFRRIDSLLLQKGPVNVAIDGNCGAGKSALAGLICEVYNCNLFHMDDFFLRPEQKTAERLNEAGGNVDFKRFNDEVIMGLMSGREFKYRKYDCNKLDFSETVCVSPKRLNIIEGSYSMHPELIKNYGLKIFLKIGEAEQRRRIRKRSGAFMLERFLSEWIPQENRYFKEFNIEELSDLVFYG